MEPGLLSHKNVVDKADKASIDDFQWVEHSLCFEKSFEKNFDFEHDVVALEPGFEHDMEIEQVQVPLEAEVTLDILSPEQLRQLVLTGRQREQQLQKKCDELHVKNVHMLTTRDIWIKEQKLLIAEAYAHAKATARKEYEKEAETERRNWQEEQQQKTLRCAARSMGGRGAHNARKLMGLHF